MKKRLPLIFGIILVMLMIASSAFAEGLDITITQDKPTHVSGDTAVLTINITNNTDTAVHNLKILNLIPTGLTYVVESAAEKNIAEILPGASAQHTILVRKVLIDVPVTGDPSHPLLWGVIILMGSAYLIRRWRRRCAS